MKQEALNFGRLHHVYDGTRAVYRALVDAVDAVGIVTAAGACGYDRSDLRRDLDRAGKRSIAIEHALAIATVAQYDARRSIVEPFAETLGFKLVDDVPVLSDKERADRYETALRMLGPVGEHAMRTALERR